MLLFRLACTFFSNELFHQSAYEAFINKASNGCVGDR